MSQPILSIVVPIYNAGKYLVETITSIEKASLSFPFEIIMVNDGSTDIETLNILDTYKDKYLVLTQENQGVSKARNYGISQAKGKYILPFDSDDVMIKDNYNKALQIMLDDDSIDILYGDKTLFGDVEYLRNSGEFNPIRLIFSDHILPNSSIYKRKVWETLNGYDETLLASEDWDFWIRAAVNNFNFYYFKCTLYKYRKLFDGKSLSQSKPEIFEGNRNYSIDRVPTTFITKEKINDYVLTSLKDDKKVVLKLCLMVFFPKIFNYLKRKNYIKNDHILN